MKATNNAEGLKIIKTSKFLVIVGLFDDDPPTTVCLKRSDGEKIRKSISAGEEIKFEQGIAFTPRSFSDKTQSWVQFFGPARNSSADLIIVRKRSLLSALR